MTELAPPAATLHAHPVDLRRVNDGLVVADAVRTQLDGVSEDVHVDRLDLRGRCRVAALDVEAVLTLGVDGHIAHIRVEEGAWSLTVRVDGPAQPTLDTDGDPQEALTGSQIADLDRAIARSSAVEALRTTEQLECSVRIIIRNAPAVSGAHWIHSAAALDRLLASERWHATAVTMATEPRILVIGDAGAAAWETGGLSVRGPDVTGPAQPPRMLDDSAYRQLRGQDGRLNLPSPAVFAWTEGLIDEAPGSLQVLGPRFNGVARSLVWYWLAAEAHIASSGHVDVTFSGARIVTLTLTPINADGAQADLALYAWAATGNDPARAEAIQHAASLAVMSPSDLDSAAAPALRTARSLYELSRRTAISEALAASRSAREATSNAARQAADTARETAGQAIQRALLQVAAASAVVLSNAANLLGRGSASLLLLLVAALSITSLVIARCVELSSASRALEAELNDLDQYRDVLASDDIAAVRKIQVVGAARTDLRRCRLTTTWVYLGSALAILIVGGLLILGHREEITLKMPPSPITTRPPPSVTPSPTTTTQPSVTPTPPTP